MTSSRSGWGECGRHARQRGAHALGGQPRWGGDARAGPASGGGGGGEAAGLAAPRAAGRMAGLAGARPCVLPPPPAAEPRPQAACVRRCESRGRVLLRARAVLTRPPNCCSRCALRPTRTRQAGEGDAECEPEVDSIRKGCQVLASQQLCKCAFWNLGDKSLHQAPRRRTIGRRLVLLQSPDGANLKVRLDPLASTHFASLENPRRLKMTIFCQVCKPRAASHVEELLPLSS